MNPQLPYYLLLFALTILLRVIRAYRTRPEGGDVTAAQMRAHRATYFFFGFELVNVSAGVFILLSEYASQFVGTVMITYVILVIFSFFIEEKGVGLKVRTVGHIVVSMLIIMVTLGTFLVLKGVAVDLSGRTAASGAASWRISIPYMDMSLNRNFGVRTNPILSDWTIEVKAASRSDAILAARAAFRSDSGPSPFLSTVVRSPISMVILDDGVIAERRDPATSP